MTSRFGIFLILSFFLIGCSDYDVGTADTPANRNGFTKHIGFEPGSDVTSVYYYADQLGADSRYQLSFKCSREVAEKIIESLSLETKPDDYSGLVPRDDFPWWSPDSIQGLPMWIKQAKDGRHFREFYYSEKDGRAFYHEYTT